MSYKPVFKAKVLQEQYDELKETYEKLKDKYLSLEDKTKMDTIKTGQSCIPAEIWFKPVCSSCEKQLNLVINYEEEIEDFTEARPNFMHKNYTITPSHCPFCGKRFETIVMPTSLPYDNRKAKRYNYRPQCNHCEYYKGTFDAKGFAGCSERKTIAVAWDEWCPEFKMKAIIATED